MFENIKTVFETAGYLINQLDQTFYWYVDVETKISWTIIVLMVILYYILRKYLSDKSLNTLELFKLLGIYIFFLGAIACSYTQTIKDMRSAFMVIATLAVIFIILMARLGVEQDQTKKKKWILFALYTPIVLLMLTNGRILEENYKHFFNGLAPRSDIEMIGLHGEVDKLEIGGTVPLAKIREIEKVITGIRNVQECAIIGYKDSDGLIKPYAYVVLQYIRPERKNDPGYMKEQELWLKKMAADSLKDAGFSTYYYPRWVTITDELPKGKDNRVKNYVLQKKKKNWSDLFYSPSR